MRFGWGPHNGRRSVAGNATREAGQGVEQHNDATRAGPQQRLVMPRRPVAAGDRTPGTDAVLHEDHNRSCGILNCCHLASSVGGRRVTRRRTQKYKAQWRHCLGKLDVPDWNLGPELVPHACDGKP